MAQGFSGGFFLPAQRSVHCKGGFFASATRAGHIHPNGNQPPPPKAPATSQQQQSDVKPRVRRVYDPEEGDDHNEGERDAEAPHANRRTSSSHDRGELDKPVPPSSMQQRCNSTSRFQRVAKSSQSAKPKPQEPAVKLHAGNGDVHNKFELAMIELNQIKDEFDAKKQQQRQNSEPNLAVARDLQPRTISSSAHGATTIQSELPHAPLLPPSTTTATGNTPTSITTSATTGSDPLTSATSTTTRDLQSPRQRLQVAEMVMRKLYKKNLQTEQELAKVQAEKTQLEMKLLALQGGAQPLVAGTTNNNLQSPPPQQPQQQPVVACARCAVQERLRLSSPLTIPPSTDTIAQISNQQLEYLRHLATEQDRTISSLKLRIEELSVQLMTAKQQQPTAGSVDKTKIHPISKSKITKSNHPAVVTKLQSKLHDALCESERQRTNYSHLKRDFQRLLQLKAKTLYAATNPQQLNTSAREMVLLMEKQLQKLEMENLQNVSAYNSKLYASEQQSCESYAQQRLMEDELARVAKDVQQRDEIDVEIEQCMATVFERLHDVESENLHLKNHFFVNAIKPTTNNIKTNN